MDATTKEKIINSVIKNRNANAPYAVINFYNKNKHIVTDAFGNKTKAIIVRIEDNKMYGLTKSRYQRLYDWTPFEYLTDNTKEKIIKYFEENIW